MKKLALLTAVLLLNGCMTITNQSGNINEIEVGDLEKMGTACSYKIFGFIGPFGDNSPVQATRSAQISRVLYYDVSHENYLLFTRDCNRTYGY